MSKNGKKDEEETNPDIRPTKIILRSLQTDMAEMKELFRKREEESLKFTQLVLNKLGAITIDIEILLQRVTELEIKQRNSVSPPPPTGVG